MRQFPQIEELFADDAEIPYIRVRCFDRSDVRAWAGDAHIFEEGNDRFEVVPRGELLDPGEDWKCIIVTEADAVTVFKGMAYAPAGQPA